MPSDGARRTSSAEWNRRIASHSEKPRDPEGRKGSNCDTKRPYEFVFRVFSVLRSVRIGFLLKRPFKCLSKAFKRPSKSFKRPLKGLFKAF